MTQSGSTNARPESMETRYRENFSRHVLEVSRYLQTRMMNTLQDDLGHTDLRLGFAPYITLLGERSCRPTELAEVLGISRQACNQAIRQIEAAGYVSQTPDPQDGRARLLVLTARGRKLRRDGVTVVSALDEQFASIISPQAAASAAAQLSALTSALGLAQALPEDQALQYGGLGGYLPRLSDYIYQRLMILTQAKGHPGLKLSFGQVLPHIGPGGGRIQKIAAIQDVSKQAISAIVAELEALNYLYREADPQDARQIVLRFTDHGKTLLRDSVASVADLEAEFAGILGHAALQQLANSFEQLFHGLGLEQTAFDAGNDVDITLLAQQLQQQLGAERSQALARLLSATTSNER